MFLRLKSQESHYRYFKEAQKKQLESVQVSRAKHTTAETTARTKSFRSRCASAKLLERCSSLKQQIVDRQKTQEAEKEEINVQKPIDKENQVDNVDRKNRIIKGDRAAELQKNLLSKKLDFCKNVKGTDSRPRIIIQTNFCPKSSLTASPSCQNMRIIASRPNISARQPLGEVPLNLY